MKARLKPLAKRAAITGGLFAARAVQAAGLMGSARGRGAIFTLHHVRPKRARLFDPNAHLEITPDFLDAAILRLKRDGYRFIALDALPAHLASGDDRPVALFTLDDGYRNNLDHAAPVFARHGVPFTVFVAGGFIDRSHTLWWETLADLLEGQTSLPFDFGGGIETVPCASHLQKQAAFERVAAFIHRADEAEAITQLNTVAASCGIDAGGIATGLTLDEDGLRRLVENPLASLGGHTISHRALARLGNEAAREEMERSATRIEAITGSRPVSFAYPYGDRASVSPRDRELAKALGFAVAVTTDPGVLIRDADMTALPRISLNGHFQKAGHVGALASGIPFRLMRGG